MKKHALLIFIGITFLSCSNDDVLDKDVLVLYNQTHCSDPWGYADNDNILVEKISSYFKTKNIEIFNVEIDNKGTTQICSACACLSGKRIITKVNKNDLNSIKEIGFQEFE